jgi:hypothetical protein
MAIYAANIISGVNPPDIQVQMVGAITYEEFTAIVGTVDFKLKQLFLEAQSNAQILQPINYNIIDSDGRQYNNTLKPKIDPYQYRSSLIQPTDAFQVILNGLSSLGFNLLPNENVTLSLISDKASFYDALDQVSKNNFKRIDDDLGNLQLWDSFKDDVG